MKSARNRPASFARCTSVANPRSARTCSRAKSIAFGPRRVRFFSENPTRPLVAELTRLTESGAIRPVVDTVYPLADIAAAHRSLERGGVARGVSAHHVAWLGRTGEPAATVERAQPRTTAQRRPDPQFSAWDGARFGHQPLTT